MIGGVPYMSTTHDKAVARIVSCFTGSEDMLFRVPYFKSGEP
jgi:hypothetical protein